MRPYMLAATVLALLVGASADQAAAQSQGFSAHTPMVQSQPNQPPASRPNPGTPRPNAGMVARPGTGHSTPTTWFHPSINSHWWKYCVPGNHDPYNC